MKKVLNSYLPDISFFKNSSIMLIGVVFSQLILFGFQFFIRRYYTPEEFGNFDVYFSIFNVLVIISCFRYDMAIVIPKEESSATNLFSLSLILALLINALIFFIILFFRDQLADLFGIKSSFSYWFFFLPMTVFFSAIYQAMNYWLVRHKEFKYSSFNKVYRRITEGTAQLVVGIYKYSFGLVLGDLIGNIVLSSLGALQMRKKGFTWSKFKSCNLKMTASLYSHFPKYNLFPLFLNTFAFSIPIILINKFYGNYEAGITGLSRMILVIPGSLISASVSQVLLQRTVEVKNKKESIKKDFVFILFSLLLISVLIIFVISFFGIQLIEIFFGKQWAYAGEIAKMLVFTFAIQFVVSPISVLFVAFERLRSQAIWQISYFCSILLLFFMGFLDFVEFIKVYVFIDILAYSAYLILIVKMIFNYEKRRVLA